MKWLFKQSLFICKQGWSILLNILIVQINLDIFVQMMIELYKSKYNKTERKCCVHKNDMTNNENEWATFPQNIVSEGVYTL